MLQVIENLRTGKLRIEAVPEPLATAGHVAIANRCSVISAGTEKMVMDLSRKSLLGKAMERPDQVRRVLEKVRNEGLFSTITQVVQKLDEPLAMGYASAGVVLACGAGVQDFKPGERVASNGPHAGVVSVPKHLCARIPDGVPFDQAAFTVLGSIALQGVRLSQIALGDTVFVIGLGLVGQLTVALLKANGCRVLGTDPDNSKCALARRMGAEQAEPGLQAKQIQALTGGRGADAVLITAATKSDAPVELAGETVRQKGRVIAVGAVGLNLPRRPYYFKEAEFVVSCSYGPGRYDPEYEERGHDYPAAHVRWTEQRNMQAFLDLLGTGGLNVGPLISHRFKIEDAEQAYRLIEMGSDPYLGIVLEYGPMDETAPVRRIELRSQPANGKLSFGCLGAGNFARMVLLPALKKTPSMHPRILCSAGGLSATHTGSKLGFDVATSDEDEVFQDPSVQAVFILTRHDQHSTQVVKGLRARKHVFVEKPLAITLEELAEIETELFSLADRSQCHSSELRPGNWTSSTL